MANYLSPRSIHVDTDQPPEASPGTSRVSADAAAVARMMTFKVRITCTPSTSWKTTLQIRKRRTGPDKNFAYKQFKGSGSRTFTIGADQRGQSFTATSGSTSWAPTSARTRS